MRPVKRVGARYPAFEKLHRDRREALSLLAKGAVGLTLSGCLPGWGGLEDGEVDAAWVRGDPPPPTLGAGGPGGNIWDASREGGGGGGGGAIPGQDDRPSPPPVSGAGGGGEPYEPYPDEPPMSGAGGGGEPYDPYPDAEFDAGINDAELDQDASDAEFDQGASDAEFDQGISDAGLDLGSHDVELDQGISDAELDQGADLTDLTEPGAVRLPAAGFATFTTADTPPLELTYRVMIWVEELRLLADLEAARGVWLERFEETLRAAEIRCGAEIPLEAGPVALLLRQRLIDEAAAAWGAVVNPQVEVHIEACAATPAAP